MSNSVTLPERMPSHSKVPKWATEAFDSFLDHFDELRDVLHLSIHGISLIRGTPNTIRVLAEIKRNLDAEDTQQSLKRAQAEAELAQQELDTGFPLLHAQGAISLWGALEALIQTFLAKWLANVPEAMNLKAIQELKVPLGEWEALDKDERHDLIVDLLERGLNATFKHGISRFEAVLEIFGLSGGVDDDDRRTLFELQQIRNVLVHRRGIVDRRLVTACPWLDLQVGRRLTIDHKAYHRYANGVDGYTATLIKRVGDFFQAGPGTGETSKVTT